MTADDKKDRRRFFDDVSTGERLRPAQIVGADFVAHHPSLGDIVGLDGLEDMGKTFRTAFPDLHYAVDDLLADADKVAVRWTARGTHRGTLDLKIMTVAASNRSIEITGTDIFLSPAVSSSRRGSTRTSSASW